MATKLIKLEGGPLIEVEVSPDQAKNISGGRFKKVEKTLQQIQPLIVETCRPIANAWKEVHKELSQDMTVEEAEIELGLSFEFGGDIYIAKSTAGTNLKVTLKLKPKNS